MNPLLSIALRLGLIQPAQQLEVVPVEEPPAREPFVIQQGDMLVGNITTSNDVIVRGAVKGNIESAQGRVHIEASGSVADGQIIARQILLEGGLRNTVMECKSMYLGAAAVSMPGDNGNAAIYESLQVEQLKGIRIQFEERPYEPTLHAEPTPILKRA